MSSSGSILSHLDLKTTASVRLNTHLVLKYSNLSYEAPDYSQTKLTISVGPLITQPNTFGSSSVVRGAIMDVFPEGTDPNNIAIGKGVDSNITDSTGRATVTIYLATNKKWTYRIYYPIGIRDPNSAVITIGEIPFPSGKYNW